MGAMASISCSLCEFRARNGVHLLFLKKKKNVFVQNLVIHHFKQEHSDGMA